MALVENRTYMTKRKKQLAIEQHKGHINKNKAGAN